MTSPGGPGYPGGPGAPWSGDDPGFGVPQQPPLPQQPGYPHQEPQVPQYEPQPQYEAQPQYAQPQYAQPQHQYEPQQHQQAPPDPPPGSPGRGEHGGAHGRPAAPASGPRWGRIGLVAAGAVLVVGAVVVAVVWLLGGSNGAVDATESFFEAVKTQDTAAAAAVTCSKAPTLAEQFGRAIKGVESTLGALGKIEVTASASPTTAQNAQPPGDQSQKRESTDFVLLFANGSVRGRATLVDEDSKWKVCFVDLEPPQTN